MIKQFILILGLCSQILLADVPELENLRGKYKIGSQKIEQAYQVGKDNLKKYYRDQLIQSEKIALEAGQLDDVLLIRKEIKYFNKHSNYKSKLVQVQIEELKAAITPQNEVIDELKQTRYENLQKTYVKYLAALVTELTKQARIKEALLVRREQTKYEAMAIGDLDSSKLMVEVPSKLGASIEAQKNEPARRPRELIPGEEAPGAYKTPQLADLLKLQWLRLNLQNISNEHLFRMKDKRVEIYIPNKEEWKAITKLEYNEGILRVKEIDYKWDSQKGYFFGTKNDEEYVLVQASKSAKIKKLFIDASELLVKGKSEKRIEKKEAKLAKRELLEKKVDPKLERTKTKKNKS